VRIIVDANIVFSAILNTNSKIADLLPNSKGIFDFIAPSLSVIRDKKIPQKDFFNFRTDNWLGQRKLLCECPISK